MTSISTSAWCASGVAKAASSGWCRLARWPRATWKTICAGAGQGYADLSGVEVLGIQEGFRWIMEGDTSHTTPLEIADIGRIHFRGGSTLGISRAYAIDADFESEGFELVS